MKTFIPRRLVLATVAFALLIGLPWTARAAERPLTATDLVEMRRVTGVQVGPGGERVLFQLQVPREDGAEPGKAYVELWLARDGESARPFAGRQRRISDPRWSPDGKAIRFLADDPRDERVAGVLWTIPADGGEPRVMLAHAGSISAHRGSPDGRWVALIIADAETEEEKGDREAGRDWKVPDQDADYHRLWLLDTKTLEVRPWVEEDLDVRDLSWSPDGKSVVFIAAPTPRVDDEYMYSSLYRVALDGSPEVAVETVGKLGPFSISPDGKQLAWLGATALNDPLAQSLFVAPLAGGPARNLSAGHPGSAERLDWIDDRTILVQGIERERSAMYRVDAKTGERRPIAWPRLIVSALSLDRDSGQLALAAHGPRHPAELFRLDLAGSEPVRVTESNPRLDDIRLAPQEVVTWTGKDGTEISGVLTYPIDRRSDVRYPLVLQVHGGPEGTSLDGWTSGPLYPVQLLAARGYAVLEPNYRGSGGRGVAFSQADHDDLGGAEFDDVLAGIDALVDRGLVDPARIGTGGWSYGGYLSAWAATRHSERFQASVVAAGLTNWIAFAGTTDIPHEMSLVHWNQWWFDHPELHWERSPLSHINKAATPTLIIHGEKDDRVHPEQSLQLYTALKIKKVPTELVLYPREPHGLNEREHQLDFIRRTLDWFDRHLRPEANPSTDPEAAAGR